MQSLEEIKRKITGTDSLKSIIRTMKIMASVNIRQYEKILKSITGYNHTIELSLQVVLKTFNKNNPYFIHKKGISGKTGVIILGSDLGMCGQFNEQISSFTFQKINSLNIESGNIIILALGERVISRIEDMGHKISENILFPAGFQTGITSLLNDLVLKLEKWRDILNIDNVLLFYNKPLEESDYLCLQHA